MNANKPVTKTLIMKHIGMDDFSCRGRKIFCVYGEKSSLIRTRYV